MRLRDLFSPSRSANGSGDSQQARVVAVVAAIAILLFVYMATRLILPEEYKAGLIEQRGYSLSTDKDEYFLSPGGSVNVRLYATLPANARVKALRMSFAPMASFVRQNGFVFTPGVNGKQMSHTLENGVTNLLLYGLDLSGSGRVEIGALRFSYTDSEAGPGTFPATDARILGDQEFSCSPYHTELTAAETGAAPRTVSFETAQLFRISVGTDTNPPASWPPVTSLPTRPPTAMPTSPVTPGTVLRLSVPGTVTRNVPFDMTVCATDRLGKPDVGYRGTVRFYSIGATATLPRPSTFTGTESGACKTLSGATIGGTSNRAQILVIDGSNYRIFATRSIIVGADAPTSRHPSDAEVLAGRL